MAAHAGLAAYIPYLRRFSRALTGDQPSGDALVALALESLIAAPSLDRDGDVRVILYRAVLRVFSSARGLGLEGGDASADERGARETLGAVPPRPRIAFLLSAMEGFASPDVAAIMEVPRLEADALIDRAGRDIAAQLRTEALIIEDEPFIALDLKTLLEDLGHTVTAIARTHAEAVKAVRRRKPGLILADIQLADGSSGLEAVNQILRDFEAPVIFVTAYPERYLTGTPPEPAFLVTKPFSVDSLKAVVSLALFFDRRSRGAA